MEGLEPTLDQSPTPASIRAARPSVERPEIVEAAVAFVRLHKAALTLSLVSELYAEDDADPSIYHPSGDEGLRWRSWPCSTCSGGVTAVGHLLTSLPASEVVSISPEENAISQIGVLHLAGHRFPLKARGGRLASYRRFAVCRRNGHASVRFRPARIQQ